MYQKISVTKPGGISPGSAAAKDPNVTIVDVEDILYFPPRDSKGIRMLGNFAMKPNARMIQYYATKSKISVPYESDGDEDSINIKQSADTQHPGNKAEIRELIQNWLGRNVIVIFGSCSEPEKEVLGTPCAPLQLKPSKQDNNDGRFHMLKWEAFASSQYLPGLYTGALALAEPSVIEDLAAVSFTTEKGAHYVIPYVGEEEGATLVFSEVTLAHGTVVSIIGSGGFQPAVGLPQTGTLLQDVASAGVKVLLKDASTWVGLAGSVINLQVFDAGATTYLIEVSRS